MPEGILAASHFIAGRAPGLTLHVRNKRPLGIEHFAEDRVLVLVHGATYGVETGFDLEIGGFSWMDWMAARGFDVYAVDVRGYGQSTRPAQMDAPSKDNPPFAFTADAIEDLAAAVDFVKARRNLDRVGVIGWSWGTTIAGGFAAKHPELVRRLVLFAPLWFVEEPPPVGDGDGPLGAYRLVTKEAARKRRVRGIPPGKEEAISPDAWFELFWAKALAADPVGAAMTPEAVRAPNGVVADLQAYWMQGKATYDPSSIKAPTLVILAEWDADTPPRMAREVFARLTGTPYKQLVVIGEGTHVVAVETNRLPFFRAVQHFLEDEF